MTAKYLHNTKRLENMKKQRNFLAKRVLLYV